MQQTLLMGQFVLIFVVTFKNLFLFWLGILKIWKLPQSVVACGSYTRGSTLLPGGLGGKKYLTEEQMAKVILQKNCVQFYEFLSILDTRLLCIPDQ